MTTLNFLISEDRGNFDDNYYTDYDQGKLKRSDKPREEKNKKEKKQQVVHSQSLNFRTYVPSQSQTDLPRKKPQPHLEQIKSQPNPETAPAKQDSNPRSDKTYKRDNYSRNDSRKEQPTPRTSNRPNRNQYYGDPRMPKSKSNMSLQLGTKSQSKPPRRNKFEEYRAEPNDSPISPVFSPQKKSDNFTLPDFQNE